MTLARRVVELRQAGGHVSWPDARAVVGLTCLLAPRLHNKPDCALDHVVRVSLSLTVWPCAGNKF